ncbi:hypothetical protein [Verrucosispora sp. NA02020]|uniref:hypothetical protein n=1 Tax=unclassified Micromonospora TaxID=2617518 RepID=UPI0015927F15|nr:hypothetical protein [Verrucosispora sp. NA02020]QKW14908.1 hypothetical protein HUT12_20425 [Verrucosispora sp. NA02020]
MAQFLLATILGDRSSQERLKEKLATARWVDASGVVDGALAVILADRFGDSPRLSEIRKCARRMVGRFRGSRLDVDEVESVMRDALGEHVSVAGIPGYRHEGLKMLLFASIAADLELSPGEVGGLLVRAEAWAVGRGFRPTLADTRDVELS